MIQTISNLVSRDFLYRQKLRQFFIFQKHQWIDSFIIIIASSLSKLMRILAESVLTPVKARIFINFVHMMRILAESWLTPLKARIFIYHQLSGFLSNYNKQ